MTSEFERGFETGRQWQISISQRPIATRDHLLRALVTTPEGHPDHEAAYTEARKLLGIESGFPIKTAGH